MREQARQDEAIVVRYTYRLDPDDGGFYAQCVEVDLAGEGKTRAAAVESLREALRLRLASPEAVAPPSIAGEHRIELAEADPSPG
jgi:hypothetical protein